jgi:translation initiation factor IF-2
MSIRLIKISKDLNVGISSLVEFLHKKGFTAVEANPNTKVDDVQYDLLLKEFGKDKKIKLETDRYKEMHTREKKNESVSIEGYEEPVAPKPKKVEEIKTEIPKDRIPHFQIVDKIDIDNLKAPKIAEEIAPVDDEPAIPEPQIAIPEPIIEIQPEIVAVDETPKEETRIEPQPEPAPVIEEIVPEIKEEVVEEKVIAAEPAGESEPSDNIFRPNTTTLKTNIVVKGTIDLSSINDK